ncbi:MAG TPA: amino acid adenylation domain-containing protein, partial [Thermoanaerobaculia bacterium]|nr:amino acid adenylation domain-containing protein [Thermoanaerobaculia bacterium]
LWERALGIAEIGVHDDFFELGGHSLLATQITADVRLRFGVDVELRPLFATPTVAGMAGAIRDRWAAIASAVAAGEEAPAIDAASTLPALVPDPAHRFDPFPLTDVQQAYWIGRSGVFELGGVATHIYTEIDAGRIDLERMTRAWRLLVDRHDMLRAVISTDGRQRVLESVPPYEIRVADLRGKGPDGVNAGIGEVRRQMSHQVIPADRWPLFEVRASVRDGERVRFHISFDFLIGDAWSWQLLTRDLVQLYLSPEVELPPLEVTFRDYVLAALAFEETPAFARDLAYWRARLADLPPAPELPLAHNPAALERPRFVRHSATLARADWQRLKERASRAGLTPSALLLAAYSEVLAAWSKNPRFAVNLTLFNRLPIHPQVGDVVGDFTSLTLLAIDASIPGSFVERAKRIQDRLWEDLDHRAVSGVRVLRELAKNGAARALMPVVFTSTLNLVRPWEGDDEEDQETLGEEGYGISQTPQVWIDHQVAEERGKLTYNWDVVEELFPPGLLASMFDAYRLLVERLASEDQVWSETRLDLAPPEQIAEQAAANRTEATFPVGANLLHRLVAAVPDEHPAIVAPGLRLGYGDLRRRARGLGSRLRDLGARPNRLVAVVMEKGWEQAVAVLGIHEAGAAYLPIDPDLPAERRAYLFENGEVEIAVVQPEVEARIAAAGEWPEGLVLVAVAAEDTVADLPALEPAQAPADLAYVIFTSGSTGRPKGVMIDHRGAVNTVLDVNARLGLGPADRVLALSALSFDLSVWDIFGTLAAGGTIVYPAADRARDPEHWAERAESEGVTIWNSVPALFEMLVERAEAEKRPLPATLRATMLSGDWIPVSLPGRARALLPNGPDSLRLISMGGATEASIWSIWFEIGAVDPSWRSIPYGRAMANQSFHVVDDRFAPRPTWVPGHLAIGGIGLALGYWRDPEKTAASFVVDPRTGARYYWTGDLGRALPGGDLEFLGREDFQVKIRGFRVELGEIEAALARQPGVREAVVLARDGNAPGEKRLAAFLIAEPAIDSEPAALEVSELRAALRAALPDYMVPSSFTMIDAFPLTANGKVDRRALPALAGDALGEERQYVAPRSDVEASLAAICAEALGVSPLGVHDDFFALGGDSLMAIRAVFRIRKAVGVELPVRTFFDRPTVAGLAEAVEDLILAEIEAMSEAEVEEQL